VVSATVAKEYFSRKQIVFFEQAETYSMNKEF